MRTYYIMLAIAILMLSTIGAAQENTGTFKVYIKAKHLGFDKNSSQQIERVNITTNGNSLGHLVYLEEYYLTDNSGSLKLDRKIKLYDTNLTSNTISLDVKRPKTKSGELYYTIKGIVVTDDKAVWKWINLTKKSNSTDRPDAADISNNKRSPGFDIVMLTGIISLAYISLKRKMKKK